MQHIGPARTDNERQRDERIAELLARIERLERDKIDLLDACRLGINWLAQPESESVWEYMNHAIENAGKT